MNQVQDDEIDLFDLLQTLFNGKWIISAFLAIAVLLGGSSLFLKDDVYEARLIYSVHTIPPFYSKIKTLNDFKNKFYSVSIFEEWKQNERNTYLEFEDFSRTEMVDGFIFSKDEEKQLVKLEIDNKGVSFLLVKSNQLNILDDVFKYARYINGLLKNEYVNRAKEELNIIETRFKDFSNAKNTIISKILDIDRFIVSLEKGSMVLAIQRPTIPKKVSPKPILILSISLVLGGIVGVFFVLILNAIKMRKEHLIKA